MNNPNRLPLNSENLPSGSSGMISTPHPLATQAGLDVLRAGGNAVDAAIAANAVLGVVMPDQCGLGGDLFALVYSPNDDTVYGLNGSGAAPELATLDAFARLGVKSMPQLGPYSVTVPGVVDAWGELNARFGSLALDNLLQAAIRIADEGFEIRASLAKTIAEFASPLSLSKHSAETFLNQGQPLQTGEQLIQKKVAGLLKTIGQAGYRTFYDGSIGEEIAGAVQALNGFLRLEDLKKHRSEWVEPISITYRGRQVYSLPPNSAGLIFLLLVNALEKLPLQNINYQSYEFISNCVAIVRQTVGDTQKWIADPRWIGNEWKSIFEGRAQGMEGTGSEDINLNGDTVALCVVDREGLGVSLIQSIYHDFGSGVFVEEGGFFLQNRGASFSFDPNHPNCLAAGKRPGHTLTPALMTSGNGLEMLFGSRGGAGQPQTLMQILSAVVDYGIDIQSALSGPRWVYGSTTSARQASGLVMEARFSNDIPKKLEADGVPLTIADDYSVGWMGCAQGIVIDPESKRYYGGADPRGGGLALGF